MKHTCNCQSCRGEGPDDDDEAEVPFSVINEWIKDNLELIAENSSYQYTGNTDEALNLWIKRYSHRIYDEFETQILSYYTQQIQTKKEDGP